MKIVKVDQVKLAKYLIEVSRVMGRYQGMLEGIKWWDVPQELKDKIDIGLKETPIPIFPNIFIEDKDSVDKS